MSKPTPFDAVGTESRALLKLLSEPSLRALAAAIEGELSIRAIPAPSAKNTAAKAAA